MLYYIHWLYVDFTNLENEKKITFVVKRIPNTKQMVHKNAVKRTVCEFICFGNMSATPLETVSTFAN